MEVNSRKYEYRIEPSYGKVVAEVFKTIENPVAVLDKHRTTEIHLAQERFGGWLKN